MKKRDTVGSYQLIEPIARGGMGEVWRARHRYLKREAAVKFIRPDVLAPRRSLESRESILRRFEREAQTTSRLHSPHTIQIFDFGRTPDGAFFYAMELVDAISLEDLVRRHGPLPEARVIYIIRQACESLAEAHRQGLIHRDIKPGNLLLGRLGLELDFVKVVDFGLVLHRTNDRTSTPATSDMTIVGTPAYMAPETITGRGDLDARSDLYSLGCVCYWLLTGDVVFPGETPEAVLASHVRTRPEPPSQNSEMPISAEMDALVLECLAKEPKARPRTATELRDRLAECRAAKAWDGEAAARWWELHRPETLLENVTHETDLDIQGATEELGEASPLSPTPRITSLVVLPLANLAMDREQEPFVLGLHDALVSELGRIGAITVISRTSALAYQGTSKPIPQIARELEVDAVLEGTVLLSGDAVRIALRLVAAPSERLLWSETYDRPVREILPLHSEVARAVAERVRISLTSAEVAHFEAPTLLNPEAFEPYARGLQLSYSFEENDLHRAMDYFRDAINRDPHFAPAYAGLGRCYNELASYGFLAPSEALPRAASAVRRALELDETHAESHADLAYSKVFFDWDFAGSRAEFERALELEPNSVACLGLFGRYLSLMGEFEHAREVLDRACLVDPLSPVPMMWRGWSSFMSRDYTRSIRDFEQLLEKSPGFPYGLLWLSTNLVLAGETDRGIELATQVEEMTGFSHDHNLLAVLGWTWGRAGRTDKARRILEHFQSVSTRRWVDPAFIATLHCTLREKDQTFEYLDRAFEVRSLLLAYLPSHPFIDGWRDDPRYRRIIQAMKGAPAGMDR